MMSSAAAADSLTGPLSRKRMHAVSSICQKRQNKPLIEKRRRARINDCLLQLKAILMKDMKKELPRPSKLEKADILEMTVDYIKKMADRRPESTDKECSTDRTGGGGGGVPFLHGFSRCMEEVDSFLNTQLPQQPEVRHKLLSHCKEQLSTKDITLEMTSAAHSSPLSSLHSASPAGDPPEGRHMSDCASDLTSEDEDRLKAVADDARAVEVKPVVSETAVTSSTALVTPFLHTSSVVSCTPSPQSSSPEQQGNNNNHGIKLAGPLKLICGGNVFIVVDQQQQQTAANRVNTAAIPPQSFPPCLSGPAISSPSMYSTSPAVAAYLPAVPQVNTFTPVNVGFPVMSFPVTGPGAGSSPQADSADTETGTLTVHSSSSSSSLSPVQPFDVELPPIVENDVNNNVMNVQAVWRPW